MKIAIRLSLVFASSALMILFIALLWYRPWGDLRADQSAVAAAEDEVYETVVRDLLRVDRGEPKVGELVFLNSVDHYFCPGLEERACEEGIRERLKTAANGTLHAETIRDFVRRSRIAGPLSTRFHTDIPRVFVRPEATGYFDIHPIENHGEKSFHELYPKASGILSLSRVGFDPVLKEAIVSSSFMCGSLCGTGRRHILKKKWGRWVVVESWIVWVS